MHLNMAWAAIVQPGLSSAPAPVFPARGGRRRHVTLFAGQSGTRIACPPVCGSPACPAAVAAAAGAAPGACAASHLLCIPVDRPPTGCQEGPGRAGEGGAAHPAGGCLAPLHPRCSLAPSCPPACPRPPAQGALVKTAKFGWRTAWQVLMTELAPQASTGALARAGRAGVGSSQARRHRRGCLPAPLPDSWHMPAPNQPVPRSAQSKDGQYARPAYSFDGQLGSAEFPLQPGRYHLFVGNPCPW